jgi:hypothetical protein
MSRNDMITESFEININPETSTGVKIEPDHTGGAINKFKIYTLADSDLSYIENLDSGNIPEDGYLGTITVNSIKNFTFEGEGILSGSDLHFIAAEIVKKSSNLTS